MTRKLLTVSALVAIASCTLAVSLCVAGSALASSAAVCGSIRTVFGSKHVEKAIDSSRVVYSASLMKPGGSRVSFKLLRSGDNDVGFITAKFVCTDRHGHVRVFFRNVGNVLADKYSVEVGDYTGSGRNQVLVTAGVRATNTLILDCDEKHLRTLYEGFCLYVPELVHASGNQWYVEEFARRDSTGLRSGTWYETDDDWRYTPYSASEEKMQTHGGPGVTVVKRLLGWSGSVFSPLVPGKSRVVVTPYRHYLMSHGLPVPRRYAHATLRDSNEEIYDVEPDSHPPTIAGMDLAVKQVR